MNKWAIAGASLAAGLVGAGLFSARTARKAEELVPRDGQMVEAGGTLLHVVEQGEGQPLLLIHGLGAQLRSFGQEMVDALSLDHRVIRVDRPGSGYSPPLPSRSQHLADQAEAIGALIEVMGLEKPWLVGHSLGGALALHVADQFPDRVAGLALIAPATQPVMAVPEVFRGLLVPLPIAGLMARTLAVPLGLANQGKVLAEVFRPEPVPDDYLTAGGGHLALRPASIEAACGDLQMAQDSAAEMIGRYPRLKLPVAILYGLGDNLLDPALHGAKTASQIPGARLTLVEGGHMLPFTQGTECARWVRDVVAGGSLSVNA